MPNIEPLKYYKAEIIEAKMTKSESPKLEVQKYRVEPATRRAELSLKSHSECK